MGWEGGRLGGGEDPSLPRGTHMQSWSAEMVAGWILKGVSLRDPSPPTSTEEKPSLAVEGQIHKETDWFQKPWGKVRPRTKKGS